MIFLLFRDTVSTWVVRRPIRSGKRAADQLISCHGGILSHRAMRLRRILWLSVSESHQVEPYSWLRSISLSHLRYLYQDPGSRSPRVLYSPTVHLLQSYISNSPLLVPTSRFSFQTTYQKCPRTGANSQVLVPLVLIPPNYISKKCPKTIFAGPRDQDTDNCPYLKCSCTCTLNFRAADNQHPRATSSSVFLTQQDPAQTSFNPS